MDRVRRVPHRPLAVGPDHGRAIPAAPAGRRSSAKSTKPLGAGPRDVDSAPEATPDRAGSPERITSDVVRTLRRELRTPINHIIGYSELLQEEAAERGLDALLPDLQKIRAASAQLLSLTSTVLDLARFQAQALTGQPGPADPATAGRETGRGARVPARAEASPPAAALVVDDNALNRETLARRLERQGYSVSLAANGREALERLQRGLFDLILLDILMPEMNGYEVLERLKADDQLRHIPVIVLSALDEIDSAVACIELGAEDYLPKPFDPVLLRARIGASLEKQRLRDQEVLRLRQIEAERRRADELLHVIFPHEIVTELQTTNTVQPRRHDSVAVLFADIVEFTPYCDRHQPQEVAPRLQRLVEAYEDLALRHDMLKIKTIGDAFMATAGLLKAVENPVLTCVRCGAEMIAVARELPERWNVRVGIHVGPVVAGVLGRGQYSFDLWGDTVNTAARMESHGVAGSITLSGTAWQQVANRCRGEVLGNVQVKGKGPLEVVRFTGFSAS